MTAPTPSDSNPKPAGEESKGSSQAPVVPPAVYVPSKDAPRGGVVGQIIMVLVVLMICGVAAGLWALYQSRKGVEAHQPQQQMPAIEVGYVVAEPVDAPINLDYLGQTAFSQRVEIRARVKGFLETRTFEEGSMVKEGQLLYRIEQTTFIASHESAKAQLAQAEARYEQAKREVARISALRAENAASQRELDDWQTNLEVSAADILAAKAAIKQAQLNLDYTEISSPINGIISQSYSDVGNYISDGSSENLLAVVGQLDPIYVQFHVSEQDLLRWRALAESDTLEGAFANLSVELLLSNGQSYPVHGKLNYVDTTIDASTGTAMVRAVFANPQQVLMAGQFVRVKIMGLKRRNALTVPQKAVIQSPAGAMVFVLGNDSTASVRPVVLGQWVGEHWIIEKGLEAGERVIVDHLAQLGMMPPGIPLEGKKVEVPIFPSNAQAKADEAAAPQAR